MVIRIVNKIPYRVFTLSYIFSHYEENEIMKSRILFLTFLLFFTGCISVEFVRKDFVPQKQGILRHSVPSSEEKAIKYRAEAEKQAREFCGGDFNITKEYQALDQAHTQTGVGTGFGFGRSSSVFIAGGAPSQVMYSFVEFNCK